ncbi:hypothetical protein LDENG_00203970 [Lucifuga dentata]|nr:hypothetical protein LDENG_00203970 [Lucifuga dentata]
MGLLRGRALAWAEAVNNQSVVTLSYDNFVSMMKGVFDHPDHCGDTAKRLLNLHQGSRSVADFSIEFRTLAADAKWDDEALCSVFLNGLSEQLKDELASHEEPATFDSLVSLAIRLDCCLRERRRERAGCSLPLLTSCSSHPPPARGAHALPVAPVSSLPVSSVEEPTHAVGPC